MEERIDKYLWAIRVFKTRGDAADACKGGKVTVNGIAAKASRTVKEGDVISVRKGPATLSYKVLSPLSHRVGASLVGEYSSDITPPEEYEKLKAPVETFFVTRDRGAGRPTKKERRTLDALWENFDG